MEKDKEDPKEISKKEFLKELNDFNDLGKKEKKEIFNMAWDSRKFEIELYWKRAVYFWAFQAVALAGYFAILSTINFSEKNHSLFYATCVGFITSLGWYLINKGSKSWQRHWESIVDILEDMVIGKLYKTVTTNKTFSVSKINELISLFFTLMWFVNMISLLLENHFDFKGSFDFKVFIPLAITIYISYQMFFGKGRGRFKEREIKLYRRAIKTK
ncbi:hypothetical protein [uncultured Algibacter sp.]|uniref:RipA family octameric membrane protein n=1 Tax=uncultured Algibacter sp. TaxID=298659 RepID=UPI00261AA36E|nr:hypothetical protein [uncultured Algibacter sp.]